MKFQFFARRRASYSAAAPGGCERTAMLATDKVPGGRQGSLPYWLYRSALMPFATARASAPMCCVEQACAAFHEVQKAIILLTKGRDDLDMEGLPQVCSRRDAAFKKVRSEAARTRSAYEAKLRVLLVMRDWLAVEDPDVAAFAIELAVEAAALLNNGCSQVGSCRETR